MLIRLTSLCLTAALLSSCMGAPISSKVTAFSAGDNIVGRSYYLVSGDPAIKSESLEFNEYANYLDTALQSQGLVPAKNPKAADLAILFSYGVSAPRQYVRSYSEPEYGFRTDHRTYFVADNSPRGYHLGKRHEPEYGLIGIRNNVVTYDEYDKQILIRASRTRPHPTDVWEVRIASTGSSDDLRSLMPYLIYSAAPYIGQSYTGPASVDAETDKLKVQAFYAASATTLPVR